MINRKIRDYPSTIVPTGQVKTKYEFKLMVEAISSGYT
jgi:hypothetical protein